MVKPKVNECMKFKVLLPFTGRTSRRFGSTSVDLANLLNQSITPSIAVALQWRNLGHTNAKIKLFAILHMYNKD